MKEYISYLFVALLLCFTACSDDDKYEEPVPETVHGEYYDGVFILNEGNMTSENGSLTFIGADNKVVADAYKEVNETELGNSSQDLFIANGKMYIISQNGTANASSQGFANDGMLVVVNAETLEKIASYDEEVKGTLNWGSHLAVVDGEIFIRDNKGVYSFNEGTKKLVYIEGSKGASKMTMAVVDKKVFVPAGKNVLVLEKGKTSVSKVIEFDNTVSAVAKSHDNKLWVSTSAATGAIAKIDPNSFETIKQNNLDVKVSAGWAASVAITAKQDTIYFSNLTTTIYRHVFASNETKLMLDAKTLLPKDASMVYNTIGVHPKTGEVYMNTITAYATYKKNYISVFNFNGKQPELRVNYSDYTRFPAGIYFTDNFKE